MAPPHSSVSSALARHYGLDWLRIGAFLLLIFHHIGRAFVSGDWLVKLEEIDWLLGPMLLVAPWRLALLFLIAGFASRAMLSRLSLGAFTRERTLRLLVPLVAAMILIIPPQSWVNLRFNHGYGGSFADFLSHHAFGFAPYDGVPQPGWEHLWFVFYLWAYTILLAAGLALAPLALRRHLSGLADALIEGRRLLWLPLLYFVPARVLVAFTLGETHGLFDDWVSDVIYLPCFLLGFALAARGGFWAAVARSWRPAMLVVAVSFPILFLIETSYPGRAVPPHALMALDRAAMAAMMWAAIVALLQLANTLLNRDHPWRARLSEAVFPFYIIHQTVIVVVAWALLSKDLSSIADFVVLMCATASGCWLFYRLGDLFPAVRPLIGLKQRPARTGLPKRTSPSRSPAG